ncbi:nucleic acid-binding, OB-fold protein [Artemisia annua]|uniref:Nucleic acid-binding, OB-fold protein n=1 Tax=Artemisia annua TaxID=35608 RepID=A0A2U1NGL0_ARTAN|nr:nucleic acid-binding, OB-fold protein [Artemisia annua]
MDRNNYDPYNYDHYDLLFQDDAEQYMREMELTSDANAASKMMANPVAPQRSLAYFADLNPTDNTKFIEARVYRRWTTMKGSAIQANADQKEKARFEHDLQPNCVYRIEGFGFEKTDGWGKTLDNDFTLCLGKHTRVDLLKDDQFPHHYFNFAAYNELDYIGYVHNVEKVKEYGSAAGNKIRLRNIALRNLNNNVVMFTLWNEKADSFEEAKYAQMRQPVVLAVSSCYLKAYSGQIQLSATSATRYYFNPPIEETSELLAAYNQDNAQVPQLEVQTEKLVDWEQERTRNRVPLATLLQIDPNTQQRVLFTQDAMIVRVDTTYDWYYQKCDECGGKLDYGFIHGHCHPYGTQSTPQNSYSFRIMITDGTANAVMTCFSPQTDGLIKNVDSLLLEVANKDPAIIPQQLLALQNTRHVFQFRFAKPTGKGPPTLILQKIMDHPPVLLPATTAGPSSLPTASASSEAASQITPPPPTTPVTTENTPADIPSTISLTTTSIVRKQLFKTSTDEEEQTQTEPECPSSLPTIPVTTHMAALKSTPAVEPTTNTDTKTHTPTIINLPATSSTKKRGLERHCR